MIKRPAAILIPSLIAALALWFAISLFADWAVSGKVTGRLIGEVNRAAEAKILGVVQPAINERSNRFSTNAIAPCFAPLKPVKDPQGPCEASSMTRRDIPTDQCRPVLASGSTAPDAAGNTVTTQTTILVASELLNDERLVEIQAGFGSGVLSTHVCNGFHLFLLPSS